MQPDRIVSPTARQLQLLRWVRGYQIANRGISPTIREIAAGLGQTSPGGVHRQLISLEERGCVHRPNQRARAIEILVAVPVPHAPDGAPLQFFPANITDADR